jgi:membrane associated rhomboid family serine protease
MMPVPLVVAAFLWAFLDFTGLFMPSDIAHGAHLAGMLIGIVYGAYIRFTYREPA